MKGWIRPLALLLLLLAHPASGAGLTLENGQPKVEAGRFLSWLADTPTLTPTQAFNRLLQGQGQASSHDFPSLGYNQSGFWFLLPITNNSDQIDWFMRVGRPYVDFFDVYQLTDTGQAVGHWLSGDARPYALRPYPSHQLVFPLALSPGHNYLLMHVTSSSVIDVPITFYTPAAFHRSEGLQMLWLGIFFGSIGILCIYNLLIFLSIKDRSYLFYFLYLGSFGFLYFSSEGLALRWLWPDAIWWNSASNTMARYLTLAFAVYFTCEFLRLSHFYPRLNRGLHYLAGALLAMALLALPFFTELLPISVALILPWPVLAGAIAVLVLLHGYVPARYFLLAFLTIGISTTLYMLKSLTILPASWLIENIIQASILVEALLLSFALAHRMAILKDANMRFQQQAKIELEDKVRERTRELNDALNARSQFLAVMSHEIRTPLNGILGTLDLLKTTSNGSEQRRYIDIIENSGSSLLQLIDDLLDYTRIEAGKMPINDDVFSLRQLAQECCDLFENRALLNGNRLQLHMHENVGNKAKGDSLRIRQILDNLISNAIKFTHDGTVDIHIKREDGNADYVLFLVCDTGIGIAENKLTQLFELFQQADSSTSRQYGGTGLGLAVCQQLVEVMGGEIGVRSQPNKGSTFWFHLPLPRIATAPPTPRALAPQPTALPPVSRKGRILVVDDNGVNLTVAAGLCRKLGHQVETCESGPEAIATLLSDTKGFDLVLMDCEMPVMDGFATTRELLKLMTEGRIRHTRIVALTAHAIPEKIRACQEAGMVMHIAKPLNLEKLNANLSKLLSI